MHTENTMQLRRVDSTHDELLIPKSCARSCVVTPVCAHACFIFACTVYFVLFYVIFIVLRVTALFDFSRNIFPTVNLLFLKGAEMAFFFCYCFVCLGLFF